MHKHTWEQLPTLSNEQLRVGRGDVKNVDKHQALLDEYYALAALADSQSFSTIYVCKHCGPQAMVQWTCLQTRSADEGSTVFCLCTMCKRRWKL